MRKKLLAVLLFTLSSSIFTLCEAQYIILHNFNDTLGGDHPTGSLTLSGNVLYGMTQGIGIGNNYGNVFSIHTDGSAYTVLHSFSSSTPNSPLGSLVLFKNVLYGMTRYGGAHGFGCIFSIDTDGTAYKDQFDFNYTNGINPQGSLIISGDKLFGMTYQGGAHDYGTVFSLDTNGTGFKDMNDFNITNGATPEGSLTLSGNVLYGLVYYGGANSKGCIFSIDKDGSGYNDFLDFNGTNGEFPIGSCAPVVLGNKLYGVTNNGGVSNDGCVFSIGTNGSGDKILHSFSVTDGENPEGSVTLSGSKLYGMTVGGGTAGSGCIFSIDTDGSGFKDLFNFSGTNGVAPYGLLTFSGTTMYGMAIGGGKNNVGVIFSFKDTATGVNKLPANKEIVKIYPNPGNGVFKFQISPAFLQEGMKYNLGVYNLLGEQVYSQSDIQKPQFNIDLSAQPNGVYLYRERRERRRLPAALRVQSSV